MPFLGRFNAGGRGGLLIGPPLQAVQEQLRPIGLMIEKKNEQAQVLVIDHCGEAAGWAVTERGDLSCSAAMVSAILIHRYSKLASCKSRDAPSPIRGGWHCLTPFAGSFLSIFWLAESKFDRAAGAGRNVVCSKFG